MGTRVNGSLIHIGGVIISGDFQRFPDFYQFVLARKLVGTGDCCHSGVQAATHVTAEKVYVGHGFISQDEQRQPNGGGLPHFHFGNIFEDFVSPLVPLRYRLDPASYFGGVAWSFGAGNGF